MKLVSIVRFEGNEKATYGLLKVIENDKILFERKTLERGWLQNKKMVSCIPEGKYNVIKTWSPKFQKNLYLVTDVPGRAGIRLHASNFAHQLNGCISMGEDFRDINNDGIKDLIYSRSTHFEFDEILNNMPFVLHITNWM